MVIDLGRFAELKSMIVNHYHHHHHHHRQKMVIYWLKILVIIHYYYLILADLYLSILLPAGYHRPLIQPMIITESSINLSTFILILAFSWRLLIQFTKLRHQRLHWWWLNYFCLSIYASRNFLSFWV